MAALSNTPAPTEDASRPKQPPARNPKRGRPQRQQHQPRGVHNAPSDEFSLQLEQLESSLRKNGLRKTKISIDHLLEFQSYRDLSEYQVHQTQARPRKPRPRHAPSRFHLTGMSFINVHYRFVVDHRSDFSLQKMDPNVPVETADILRIVVPKGNACPICLCDEPVAPRMITSCGHILCLTCLLSLLESEVPVFGKRDPQAVVAKYCDCPLCAAIIRPADVKPVLISSADDRFDVPKPRQQAVLTLMTRQHDRMFPLPAPFLGLFLSVVDFPWFRADGPGVHEFLRVCKGDLDYLLEMYAHEQSQILAAYEQEKLLYNDDGKYVRKALANIAADIEHWRARFAEPYPEKPLRYAHQDKTKDAPKKTSGLFYYYETGFNAESTYVLSPLDIKVLKASHGDSYSTLPSSIVVNVENIRYEELDTELVTTKYKYLAHLPIGTSVGFLECDWSNSEHVSPEVWAAFSGDLSKRTKAFARKFNKEEQNKRRALNDEEMRTRDFYRRENGGGDHESGLEPAHFGSLTITDHRELPQLTSEITADDTTKTSESEASGGEYETTIWGTRIRKSEAAQALEDEQNAYDWDAEEMIRRAKAEMDLEDHKTGGKKKKKKKKLVLLSSDNWA